jgi:4a-hydroxytetrahydrobiopterin dehydratase
MSPLADEHPREYPRGAPSLPLEKIEELAGETPAWTVEDLNLERRLSFADFNEAFGFVVQIALLAEAESHHPDICIAWNQVELTFSTHTAEGLTRNDFIMAAKVDRILAADR